MCLEYVSELYQPVHHGHRTCMSKYKVQTTLAIPKQQLRPKDHLIPQTQTVEQLT